MEPSSSVRFPEESSFDGEHGEHTGINSLMTLPEDGGFILTIDFHYADQEEVSGKVLVMLDRAGQAQWTSTVIPEVWWMNQDVIRAMPDGDIVVGSDEDSFSPILHINRFSESGEFFWSADIDTGGEMIHRVLDIIPSPGGSTLLIGATDLFMMQYHGLFVMLDEEGGIMKETLEHAKGHLVCNSGMPLEDRGGFPLTGWTWETNDDAMHPVNREPVLVLLDPFGNVMGWNTFPAQASNTVPMFILETENCYALVGNCWDDDDYDSSDVFVQFIGPEDIPEDG